MGTAGESGRGEGGASGRGTSGEGGKAEPEGGMGGESGSESTGGRGAMSGAGGAGGNAGASAGSSGVGGNAGASAGASGAGGAGGSSGSGGAAAGMAGSAGSGPTGFSGPDPTLYYTFDARDLSGNALADRAGSYDGTVGTSIQVEPNAPVGDAMVFPGGSTQSSIVSPNVPLADRFTLSVWIKTSAFPTGEALRPLSLGAPRPTEPIGRGWALGIVSGELRFAVHATLSEIAAFPIALDQWVHAVAVSDVPNRTIRIYRNGALADETATEDPSIIFATAGFVLGYQTTTNDRFFVGAMDELALFSGLVLTPAQSSELYALGSAGTPIRN